MRVYLPLLATFQIALSAIADKMETEKILNETILPVEPHKIIKNPYECLYMADLAIYEGLKLKCNARHYFNQFSGAKICAATLYNFSSRYATMITELFVIEAAFLFIKYSLHNDKRDKLYDKRFAYNVWKNIHLNINQFEWYGYYDLPDDELELVTVELSDYYDNPAVNQKFIPMESQERDTSQQNSVPMQMSSRERKGIQYYAKAEVWLSNYGRIAPEGKQKAWNEAIVGARQSLENNTLYVLSPMVVLANKYGEFNHMDFDDKVIDFYEQKKQSKTPGELMISFSLFFMEWLIRLSLVFLSTGIFLLVAMMNMAVAKIKIRVL